MLAAERGGFQPQAVVRRADRPRGRRQPDAKGVGGKRGVAGNRNDPSKVGFSIRQLGGKVLLYHNVEFPPFLDMKRKMSKKSLEDEFVRRYEIKLVRHTIFTLNYDFVDEDDFPEEQRKRVRNLLCAMAESLALASRAGGGRGRHRRWRHRSGRVVAVVGSWSDDAPAA